MRSALPCFCRYPAQSPAFSEPPAPHFTAEPPERVMLHSLRAAGLNGRVGVKQSSADGRIVVLLDAQGDVRERQRESRRSLGGVELHRSLSTL